MVGLLKPIQTSGNYTLELFKNKLILIRTAFSSIFLRNAIQLPRGIKKKKKNHYSGEVTMTSSGYVVQEPCPAGPTAHGLSTINRNL